MLSWYHTLLIPQPQSSVGSSTDAPRLPGMPIQIHNTQSALDFVTPQDLQRHNSGILHQVIYDFAVEDLQATVVTSIRKEWQATLMELDRANGFLVEAQRLIRLV
jgi:hypothetical protein